MDFLSKKTKLNEGEVPQYYVENDHPAIIEPEVFDIVQSEIVRRASSKSRYSGVDRFAAKIKCGQCGSSYGPKVWHSTDKYRRVVYQCNHKSQNGCTTPHLDERQITQGFIAAVNKLISEKEEIIANMELVRDALCDTADLEQKAQNLNAEMCILVAMMENSITENTRTVQNQEEYRKRYSDITTRYESVKAESDMVRQDIADRKTRCEALESFISALREQGPIIEFDERLWGSLLDCVVVSKEGVRFVFKDGTTE